MTNQQQLTEFIESGIEIVTSFFGVDAEPRPNVLAITSRKEMDAFCERETQSWVVASSRKGKIGILSPEVFEKESSHKYSDEKYRKLLTHEICHYYQERITGTYKPAWLGEGLAVYVSGQYEDMKSPEEFKIFLDFHSKGGPIYVEAGFLIKSLIERFGKEKVLEYVKAFKEDTSEEFAKKKFGELFGMPLTYDEVNKLIAG